MHLEHSQETLGEWERDGCGHHPLPSHGQAPAGRECHRQAMLEFIGYDRVVAGSSLGGSAGSSGVLWTVRMERSCPCPRVRQCGHEPGWKVQHCSSSPWSMGVGAGPPSSSKTSQTLRRFARVDLRKCSAVRCHAESSCQLREEAKKLTWCRKVAARRRAGRE